MTLEYLFELESHEGISKGNEEIILDGTKYLQLEISSESILDGIILKESSPSSSKTVRDLYERGINDENLKR